MNKTKVNQSLVIENIDESSKLVLDKLLNSNPQLKYNYYDEENEYKVSEFVNFNELSAGDVMSFPEGLVLRGVRHRKYDKDKQIAQIKYKEVIVNESSQEGSIAKILSDKVRVSRVTNKFIILVYYPDLYRKDRIKIKYKNNKYLINK